MRAGGLELVLAEVAKGDHAAFRAVYDQAAPAVLGIVRRVLRDPAQSEEVMQEVLLEVWRTAARFDPSLGSASAWIMTLAHRRAVDRVRSEQRAAARELRAATASIDYDEVSDAALTTPGARAGPALPRRADRPPARVGDAGLLRRLQLPGGRPAARRGGRHGQDAHARRPDQAAGLPGGGVMRARGAALHTLVGAYVMDAVTEKDRAGFERHLLTCEQCREDVRGLREAAAHLAEAAAVPPASRAARADAQAAERIRQLPPVVPGEQAGRRGAGACWRPGACWLRGSGRQAPVAGQAGGVHRAVALAVTAIVLWRAPERDAGQAERRGAAR